MNNNIFDISRNLPIGLELNLPFIKMHGLGNDFIIINEEDYLHYIKDNHISKSALAKQMSDYKMSVGCDQFIIYKIDDLGDITDNISVKMEIFNNDGSKANLCGNATRCLAKLIFDRFDIYDIRIYIEDVKDIYVNIPKTYDGKNQITSNIAVNMGPAFFKKEWMVDNEILIEFLQKYSISAKEFIMVDVGNPHLVIINNMLDDNDMEIISNEINQKRIFPHGVNINFVSIKNNEIFLKVHERGVGFTLACGSGACASFIATRKLGALKSDNDIVVVNFSTGKLYMSMMSDNIVMDGPASYSFVGYI